jgi:hypothetical protein
MQLLPVIFLLKPMGGEHNLSNEPTAEASETSNEEKVRALVNLEDLNLRHWQFLEVLQ